MPSLTPWLLLSLICLGHLAIWLGLLNRVNATGWPRRRVKRLERAILLVAVALPLFTAARGWPLDQPLGAAIRHWLSGLSGWERLYGAVAIAVGVVGGANWLWDRRWLLPPTEVLRQQTGRHWDVAAQLERPYATRWMERCARLPGNQIGRLELTEKRLLLPRLPSGWPGLRIGHLSDLHLTGRIDWRYHRRACELLAAQTPQVVAITGDILDYDSQLMWLPAVLEPLAEVPLRLFVLGNHDLRLSDTDQLRRLMVELGWIDLGRTGTFLSEAPVPIAWWGDERPWYPPSEAIAGGGNLIDDRSAVDALPAGHLRLGLAHTPDRFVWARQQRLDLLLAGHTHGGQIRLPGIGPLVAPSWYGSRWASGVFHWKPTVMHVSRGLSGVHPIRLRCAPEVSLLRLEASG
jgi:uncharacterized protein